MSTELDDSLARRSSRSSGASGCCTGTCRTASACRSCTRAGPARRWRQIAIEEWMAASPVYSLRTQRALQFGERRRADDPEEHPARHRRAAALHGLPLPGRRRRTTASSGSRTAARCSTWSRWARTTCTGCATRSRTRPSTRPRARRTRAPRCGPCTGRRASRPTGTRTATGRSRSIPTSRRSRRIPYRAIVERSKIAGDRDRASRRDRTDAEPGGLGRLLRRLRSRLRARGSLASRARDRAAGGRGPEPPAPARLRGRGGRAVRRGDRARADAADLHRARRA